MPRVQLITGSSGIAAATAKIATEAGDSVFLIGNDHEQCQALSSQLPRSAYFVADVSDETAVGKAVTDCVTRMPRPDALAATFRSCSPDVPATAVRSDARRPKLEAGPSPALCASGREFLRAP